jgi:hypothetical protein
MTKGRLEAADATVIDWAAKISQEETSGNR